VCGRGVAIRLGASDVPSLDYLDEVVGRRNASRTASANRFINVIKTWYVTGTKADCHTVAHTHTNTTNTHTHTQISHTHTHTHTHTHHTLTHTHTHTRTHTHTHTPPPHTHIPPLLVCLVLGAPTSRRRFVAVLPFVVRLRVGPVPLAAPTSRRPP
jgi:hypothetical protein